MRASPSNFGKNVLLLLTSVTVSLLVLEFAFRLWMGVPLLTATNFRHNAGVTHMMGTVVYDPDLGWTNIPNASIEMAIPYSSRRTRMDTLDYGVRKNGPDDKSIRTGGLLAVGDSFTAGSETSDDGSWPAQLEKIIRQPVINAGVGAYGTDQTVIQAERLIPVVNPKVLLVGILDQDIYRAGHSVFGAPKPYYTIENNELVSHKPQPPTTRAANTSIDAIKSMLGYSFVADKVMRTYDPTGWLGSYSQSFKKTGVDEVSVTCLLLKQLKQRTEKEGIRTLLIMQYGGAYILNATQPSTIGIQVEECASKMGYQIVDEFESLKAIATTKPDEFRSFYYVEGNSWGHMSEVGNLHIAKLIAAALNDPQASGQASDYQFERLVPGDGKNLLPKSEALSNMGNAGSIATFRKLWSLFGRTEYEITAGGNPGEHYVSLGNLALTDGPYTLSLEVLPNTTSYFRAQIVDGQSNGVIGDFDLKNDSVSATRLGKSTKSTGRISALSGGWYRLQLTATLPDTKASIIFGLGDSKNQLNFSARGESIKVRAIQLERGQSPSEYKPTK